MTAKTPPNSGQNATKSALSVRDVMAQSGVAFGTSGARGLVAAMTDRVCFAYCQGFLRYLAEIEEFTPGGAVALAGDLRASTPRIMAACAAAIRAMGGVPVNCGFVPTPALALYAFGRGIPSLMVTGSHIPDDRNGIKFYRRAGEVLKADEAAIAGQPLTIDAALFDAQGMLRAPTALPALVDVEGAYVARYVAWFGAGVLKGLRVGVYQHSSVARDLLVRLLGELGARVTPLGRSARFVPVDTEAIRPEDAALALGWAREYGLDALCSTDGDADRPLFADASGQWLRGDVLGVLCARELGADRVVTPVSSNSVAEGCGAFARVVRTRIGSPYVIAAMAEEVAAGGRRVCGYEANGGFLLASDLVAGPRHLAALPTRDAVLPIVALLVATAQRRLAALRASLPARFTHSDRIEGLPTATSQRLIAHLVEGDEAASKARVFALFGQLAGAVAGLDQTDGLRIGFANGEVIHLRPSGNAPELRCYTEAADEPRAAALNHAALALVRAEAGAADEE